MHTNWQKKHKENITLSFKQVSLLTFYYFMMYITIKHATVVSHISEVTYQLSIAAFVDFLALYIHSFPSSNNRFSEDI